MNYLSDVRILEKNISAFKHCINRPCSHPRSKVTIRVKKSTFTRSTLKMVKYFQVHRTCFKKFRSKNAFFHFFKNVKKHIHDAKNSSSQLLALWIFFIFWIRVKTLDSYFFRYSKRDLESN